MPRDGGAELDGDAGAAYEDQGPADAVLVMDADGPTAEQVVLQLILARCGRSPCVPHMHVLISARSGTSLPEARQELGRVMLSNAMQGQGARSGAQ